MLTKSYIREGGEEFGFSVIFSFFLEVVRWIVIARDDLRLEMKS